MKVSQSWPTLYDPMDYTVHGILQARILEWVDFPFSRDLPNPGIKPRSAALQEESLLAESQGKLNNNSTLLFIKPIVYARNRMMNTIQNILDTVKAMLRGKFTIHILMQAYLEKQEKHQTS